MPNTQRLLQYTIVVVLVAALFAPLVWQMHFVPSDYALQIPRIERSFFNKVHILHPGTVYAVFKVTDNILTASTLVNTLFYVATGLIHFELFCRALDSKSRLAVVLAIFMALITLIITPVNIFTAPTGSLRWGYVNISHHNPTMVVVKAFALPLFLLCVSLFRTEREMPDNRFFVAIATLTIFSLIAKPSYMIALLPAVGLVGLYRLVRREYVDVRMAIIGLAVPAVMILAAQYIIQYLYVPTYTDSEIAFQPFAVLNYHAVSPNGNAFANQYTWAKFLLSVLFPLVIYASSWRTAATDIRLNTAWVLFIVGALFQYLVVETGELLPHWNFSWTGEMGLFVLLVVSMLFYVEQNRALLLRMDGAESSLRFRLATYALALHVISGLVWYYLHVTGRFIRWF